MNQTEMIHGAEARVETGTYLGRPVVVKDRIVKGYRHPALDAVLRDRRTRDEAHLLVAARRAGVPAPVVYDMDRQSGRLMLEYVHAPSLRDELSTCDDAAAQAHMAALGTHVARLHDAGITHGDLTTSNVLVSERGLVLIDFGLGQSTDENEPRGVDLHLLEEALEATDGRAHELLQVFMEAYGAANCAPGVLRRLEAIRARGRYR